MMVSVGCFFQGRMHAGEALLRVFICFIAHSISTVAEIRDEAATSFY